MFLLHCAIYQVLAVLSSCLQAPALLNESGQYDSEFPFNGRGYQITADVSDSSVVLISSQDHKQQDFVK